MASITNNATVSAGQSFGPKTHILTLDDISSTTAAAAMAEAQQEGFTVVAIEGTANTNHFALQGSGTPSITDCTVVVTFDN